MKTFYKSVFFCLFLLLGLTACDKDEIPPTGPQYDAEKFIAGAYPGEWTRTNLSTQEVESSTGSLTFTADEALGNNVTVMSIVSDGLDLGIGVSEVALNVTKLSSGELVFWTIVESSPFGEYFNGRVSPEGVVTMSYVKTVKQGRKEYEFQYTFTGKK